MKKLLVIFISSISLLSFGNDQCTISIDYQISSTVEDVSITKENMRPKTVRALKKILKSKNYQEVSLHWPSALYFGSAQYDLKLRANVELRSSGISWEDFQGEGGFEETATASLFNLNQLVDKNTITTNPKRRLARLITDIDYLYGHLDRNNSRVKTIFNKNRLDKLLLEAVSGLEDCPNSKNVNDESENVKFGNGLLYQPGKHVEKITEE